MNAWLSRSRDLPQPNPPFRSICVNVAYESQATDLRRHLLPFAEDWDRNGRQ
jgi:hypothetical protein